jgi:hypothetical protein
LTTLQRIALGEYDWKRPEITNELFPNDLRTVGEWEFCLCEVPKFTFSDNIVHITLENDWKLAQGEHLLSFGQAFPDEQFKSIIIALGSVCYLEGCHCVLGLWANGCERNVDLFFLKDGFNSFCKCLYVRKVK